MIKLDDTMFSANGVGSDELRHQPPSFDCIHGVHDCSFQQQILSKPAVEIQTRKLFQSAVEIRQRCVFHESSHGPSFTKTSKRLSQITSTICRDISVTIWTKSSFNLTPKWTRILFMAMHLPLFFGQHSTFSFLFVL